MTSLVAGVEYVGVDSDSDLVVGMGWRVGFFKRAEKSWVFVAREDAVPVKAATTAIVGPSAPSWTSVMVSLENCRNWHVTYTIDDVVVCRCQ